MTIARRVQYQDEPIEEAGKHAVEALQGLGGEGGVIVLDSERNSKRFVSRCIDCNADLI